MGIAKKLKEEKTMQAEAIAKLRAEISGSNNPAVKVIGEFLLQHLEQNPDDAGSVLQTDKTIAKSLEAMRKVAEKKKVGNMAVLSDAEGFAIVLNYYKSEEPVATPAAQPKSKATAKAEPVKTPEPEVTGEADPDEDDLDFDALLM